MNKSKQETSTYSKTTPGYIEVIGIALIIVGTAFYVYDSYFAQKIKIVDMSGYFRQQKALMIAGDLTKDNFADNLNRVEALINQDAADNKNQIYILKEVVLKNGDELSLK